MSPWLPGGECTFTGCRVKVPYGRTRCRGHASRGLRRSSPRPLPPNWREIRQEVLDRDPICVLCPRECPNESTVADHIVDRADGGSDELDNLQGVCKPCHDSKTARTRGFARRKET